MPDRQKWQHPIWFALLQGLKETGYVEGQNVAIEYRFADYQNERLPALASRIWCNSNVRVIFATGGPAAPLAAKVATATDSDRFSTGGDPVWLGSRGKSQSAGRNITGSEFPDQWRSGRNGWVCYVNWCRQRSAIGFLVDPDRSVHRG